MFVNYILVLLYCFVGDVLFKYFSHVYWFYQSVLPFCFLFYYYFLFSHFIVLMFFKDQMFYILKKPNLLFFFFYVLCFFVLCRKLLHMSEFKDFSYAFTRNSIALNQYSFFFHEDIELIQHHLLRRFFLLHLIALAPLRKNQLTIYALIYF